MLCRKVRPKVAQKKYKFRDTPVGLVVIARGDRTWQQSARIGPLNTLHRQVQSARIVGFCV